MLLTVIHFGYPVFTTKNAPQARKNEEEPTMSKVILSGTYATIVSTLTLDQIKLCEKHRPNALKLFDPESKEVLFAVASSKGSGSVSKYGVSFGNTAPDESGLAVLSFPIPEGAAKPTEKVADYLGVSILNLNKVEAAFAAAAEEIKKEKAEIAAAITVVA
jgi:hypothetical protein